MNEETSGGSFLKLDSTTFTPAASTAALGASRVPTVTTLSGGATVGAIQTGIQLVTTVGQAINVTVRIGFPQTELGAIPTSPIPTSGAALTRAADLITLTAPPIFNTNGHTLFAKWIQPPVTPANFPTFLQDDDGTNNNRDFLFLSQASGKASRGNSTVAGIAIGPLESASAYVQGAVVTTAYALSPTRQSFASNGAFLPGSRNGTFTVPTVTSVRFGGNNFADAYIQGIKIWATQALSDGQLQRVTQ